MVTHWQMRRRFPELSRRGIAVEIADGYRNPAITTHIHDVCYLSLLRRGSARHQVGDKCWVESPGTITVVHPGIQHAIIPNRQGILDYTNVYLDQDAPLWERLPAEAAVTLGRFLRHSSDPGMAVLSLPLLDPLRTGHWLTLIEREQRQTSGQVADATIAHLAALFLIDVSRSMRDGVRRPVPWGDPAVGRAVTYLEAHFSDSMSLTVLATAAGISPWELCRRCRACTGLSVGDLVRTRRIEESLRLLLDPQQRIIDIAYTTGFGSITAFNRAFKALVGSSPREYRAATHP